MSIVFSLTEDATPFIVFLYRFIQRFICFHESIVTIIRRSDGDVIWVVALIIETEVEVMVIVGVAKANRFNIAKFGTCQILFRDIFGEDSTKTVATSLVEAKETVAEFDVIVFSSSFSI